MLCDGDGAFTHGDGMVVVIAKKKLYRSVDAHSLHSDASRPSDAIRDGSAAIPIPIILYCHHLHLDQN